MIQVGNFDAIQAQLPMFLHHHDAFQNVLWAMTLGAGGAAPVAVVGTAYSNTFEPAAQRSGPYATLVRDKVVYVSEVPGCMFTGFEIRVGEMGRMEIDWSIMGDVEKSDSVINTSTQVAALTFPTQGMRWFFRQAVIRLNAQSGGALGAGDAVKVTNFKLKFEQKLDVKFVGGQQTIIAPLDNGFPTVTLDLTFARFDSVSQGFFTTLKAGTRYKGDIIFTGPAADATTYGLKFEFPHLAVMSHSTPLPNTAQGEPKATFEGLSTSAAPTGMAAVTRPFRVTTTGLSSTNPFV
jgi:hypothetical protein